MTKALLLTHAAVTLFLVGLIWTIQIVHYPLFAKVGLENAVQYQAEHQWRITVIVLPAMLLELATSGLLIFIQPAPIPSWLIWLGALLVVIIWGSTFFLQVPQHSVLDRGFDPIAHALLVSTNWLRTLAWTARGAIAFYMLSLTIP
jgi:hypothetical protein